MKQLLALLLLSTLMACSSSVFAAHNDQRYVLLVSFDGFRHDYVDRWDLTHFKKLRQHGSYAESLIPSFPSNTFPNHYSIVTGLYPGNHGLVDNSFYNPDLDKVYSMANASVVTDDRFYGGEPLWQYVQRFGMKSASYFWVGSEAAINGSYPDYYVPYNSRIDNTERIDQVFDWFLEPESKRPNFVSLYFSFVDSISHDTGPLSADTHKAAIHADQLLGNILEGLDSLPIKVNLLVVSDHGMLPVDSAINNIIPLDKLGITNRQAVIIRSQTKAMYYVRDKRQLENIYQQLKSREDHFTVYKSGSTPAHWQYSSHENIGDIILIADRGYVLRRTLSDFVNSVNTTIGVHGYDPQQDTGLNGIFYARGPNIQPGLRLLPIENVHVFPFITRLLNLPDATAIDGSPEILSVLLRRAPE